MQIAKIGVLLMVAGAQGNSISGTKPGFNVPWNLGKQTPSCWKLKEHRDTKYEEQEYLRYKGRSEKNLGISPPHKNI